MDYYEGIKYHMEDALKEAGKPVSSAINNPDIALFSREYYNQIQKLNHDKIYDYVFIGSFRNTSVENREWILDFAKKNFTKNSVFINTTGGELWNKLGPWDLTGTMKAVCPAKDYKDNQSKEAQYRIIDENRYYFETMCQSKFCLCPQGDSPWSFRFYEVLMCKSIPIVQCWTHTFRTETESTFGYRYLLNTDTHIFDPTIIEHNTEIFERKHLLPKLHIYTYSTDMTKMESFSKSVKMFGSHVNCIFEDKWDGYHDKIFNLLKNIKDVPDNEIICFIDGYDLFVNSNTDEIITKFLNYNCDLLFGAELNCFPENESLKKKMEAIKCLTKYRYVNSGGYIGYASAIRKLLTWKSPTEIKKICEEGTDQLYFAEYFIANNVQLDYRQKIFQNMYRVSWREISVKNNRFYNKKIDEYPCFVHFSGGSGITKFSKRSVIPTLLEFIEQNDGKRHLLDKAMNFEPLSQV
jgi:hypothetical protein